ncbi:MAG TPA: peptidase [Lacipirellulaceae bacterium]|nr:peptidase [Lacipirellulaceae bacterium]
MSRRLVAALLLWLVHSQIAASQTLQLKDGRKLEGKFAQLSSVAENPLSPKTPSGEVAVAPLVVVDDGLRRTFIHSFQIAKVMESTTTRDVRIHIWQPVAETGGAIGRVGRALRVTPFDEYGRRIYEMQGSGGPLPVVQGITLITPLYTEIEGLSGGPRPIVWDMRIATSSIPRETLSRVLSKAVKPDDLEGRLQIVRLYLTSERYRDAAAELEQIIKAFPERKDLQQDVRELRQLGGKLILKEIQLREKAGQHQLARSLLTQFPSEGISSETLQVIRELLDKYAAEDARRKNLLEELNNQVAKIQDDNGRHLAEGFAKEIAAEANEDAINRLASFERLADDAKLSAEQKVALAVSGWLVGANQATDNFQTAVSLSHARDSIRTYLREPLAANRSKLAADIHDMEGATIQRVAQILKLMKPPLDLPKPAEDAPRMYELKVAGLPGEADIRYLVQVPLEYDPLRHYPTIVTLADAGVSPEQMLDFWAGPKNKSGERLGQAVRHGYIVIAVDWQEPHQFSYEYSEREHNAVLCALRDACRRFSIDTDRVFLTGHGMGGDAAWDIAIAHPDLWAGVMPISAVADEYVGRYAENARYLNWYVVSGELDGDKMAKNGRELDRYMRPGSDVTVVEYEGRGDEPFGDEIQRIFQWMALKQRTMPKDIDCVSMRPWDSFFWWLEAEGLPARSMVAPPNWPPKRSVRPAPIKGKRLETNKVTVQLQAKETTVWLSPELVDFGKKLVVEVNGHALTPPDHTVQPNLTVLLEDVRTRADRQHPFWAKLSTK